MSQKKPLGRTWARIVLGGDRGAGAEMEKIDFVIAADSPHTHAEEVGHAFHSSAIDMMKRSSIGNDRRSR